MKPDIGQESHFLPIPPVFSAIVGATPLVFANMFDIRKTTLCYKKNVCLHLWR